MDQRLSYQVDQIVTVLPEETEAIAIEEGRDYVTLLTCIPYGINSHRLLVRGVRTEDGGGTEIYIKFPFSSEILLIRDYVTLLTCIPYGINSHRLLVRGVRTEDGGGTEIYIKFPFSSEILLIFIVSGTAVLFLLDIILVLKFSTGKKHQEGKDKQR